MDYLQKWWKEKYPNAGVEKIVNVSEGVIDIEHLIDFEQWLVKKLIIPDVIVPKGTLCGCGAELIKDITDTEYCGNTLCKHKP